jgi:exonuclease III
MCLQETHCGAAERPTDHIPDFASIPHCRKISSNNRYFGGMLLLIRKSVRKGVKVTYDKDPDILGITLSKEFFGMEQDLLVWFTYAPPATSHYRKGRDNVLECLERQLISNDNFEHSLIMGDLNAKTATEADFLADKRDNHSPYRSNCNLCP